SASGGDDPVHGLPRPAPGLDSGERPRPPARRLRVVPPGEGGPLRLPPRGGSGRSVRRLPRAARLREPPAPHAPHGPTAPPPGPQPHPGVPRPAAPILLEAARRLPRRDPRLPVRPALLPVTPLRGIALLAGASSLGGEGRSESGCLVCHRAAAR